MRRYKLSALVGVVLGVALICASIFRLPQTPPRIAVGAVGFLLVFVFGKRLYGLLAGHAAGSIKSSISLHKPVVLQLRVTRAGSSGRIYVFLLSSSSSWDFYEVQADVRAGSRRSLVRFGAVEPSIAIPIPAPKSMLRQEQQKSLNLWAISAGKSRRPLTIPLPFSFEAGETLLLRLELGRGSFKSKDTLRETENIEVTVQAYDLAQGET